MAKEIATKTKLDTRIAADIAAAMPVANQPAAAKAAAAPSLAKKAIVIDTEEVQAAVEQAVEGSADVIVAQAAAGSASGAAAGGAAAGMSTTALVVAGVAVAAAAGGGSSSSSSTPVASAPTAAPTAAPAPTTLTVTLDSVKDQQNYSTSTANITMTINGDDDATVGDKFDVTLGSGNDTVVIDTYLRADVNAGAGNDTLDLREFGMTLGAGDADVNLATGVANADFKGSFLNFENVIANDDGGRLVGTDGANKITLGEGDDDISAAAGDDIIIADGDTLTTNDAIDGGSGTDTLTVDGEDTINLDTKFGALSNVENIELTGTEDNDVTLTMGVLFDSTSTAAIVGGIRNIKIVDDGSDENIVAITSAVGKDINLIGVTFTNVDTLDTDADANGTNVIRIDSNTLKGIKKVTGTADDEFALSGGTYDFSGVVVSGMTEINGSSTKADTVQFGVDVGSIASVTLGATEGDVVTFANTDSGDISAITTAFTGVDTIEFGSATSVVIDDGHLAAGTTIKGTTGTNDQLTINGTTTGASSAVITGVEKIIVDGSGSAVAFTIGTSTLEKGVTVIGDSATTDTVTLGSSTANIVGVTFKDFEVLNVGANTLTTDIATLSTFSKIDGTTTNSVAGKIVLTDSGAVTFKTLATNPTGVFTVQGAAGDDTWTLSAVENTATKTTFRTGDGNDTVIGNASGNVLTATEVYLDAGNDTYSTNDVDEAGGVIDGGAGVDTLSITDALVGTGDILAADYVSFEKLAYATASTSAVSITLGANDVLVYAVDLSADTNAVGDNVINVAAGASAVGYTITGSAGKDTVTTSVKGDTVIAGGGNDEITVTGSGVASAAAAVNYTLTGGSGSDTFILGANTFNSTKGFDKVTITDWTAGDKIDTSAITANTDVLVSQAVSQALVNAVKTGGATTLTEALNALSAHAENLASDALFAFQFDGNTYLFIDTDQTTADVDLTKDLYVKLTGLVDVTMTSAYIIA